MVRVRVGAPRRAAVLLARVGLRIDPHPHGTFAVPLPAMIANPTAGRQRLACRYDEMGRRGTSGRSPRCFRSWPETNRGTQPARKALGAGLGGLDSTIPAAGSLNPHDLVLGTKLNGFCRHH